MKNREYKHKWLYKIHQLEIKLKGKGVSEDLINAYRFAVIEEELYFQKRERLNEDIY